MKVGVLVRKKSRNVDGVVQAANIANRLQSDFEFDVEQVDWLQKGNGELRRKDVARRVKEKHVGKHLIVIISPPLKGDYFDYARRGMNIVSTAGWDSRFAPPPLSIYVLFQLADSVASFVADLSPRQVHRRMRHNGFRACLFNSTEGRRRFLSVLIAGYVCADCRARLREWGVSATQLDSIGHLLSYVRDFTIEKPRYMPNAVFIGHGRRADWEKIRNHISKKHRLKVEEFNVSPTAGFTTVERLTEMLESASFAILVMTAEDRQRDGRLKARQNVVHEIGLFQGRLGFARAIVVKEDGVEEFCTDTHTSARGFVIQPRWPIVDIRCLPSGTASAGSDTARRRYGFLSAKPRAETVLLGCFQEKHCNQRNGWSDDCDSHQLQQPFLLRLNRDRNWRKIPIALIDKRSKRVMAC